METTTAACAISFSRPSEATLLVRLSGKCSIAAGLPSAVEIEKTLETGPQGQRIDFDADGLTSWDSSLLTFLLKLGDFCAQHGITFNEQGLPQGVTRLLALAKAVPEQKDARRKAAREPFLDRIGNSALHYSQSATEMLAFIGAVFLAFLELFRGKARFRRCDLTLFIQECGVAALPIVSLISILVGLILAFVGAIQLRMFGAQIYVADLVGLGMAREMGAMMTAIIMAGRTGAAFAAQLGTMQVNEEIDALETLGISPIEFLVLPRMLALVMMLPLLCLYADFMGILGGGLVGMGMLDLSPLEYFHETRDAVRLIDFSAGIFKSAVFGVLVALAGCLRGLQCGRSSSAVGLAATSAVVTGIVWIVVADATLTVLYDLLEI
jgi:phospholipid/cholesterol/gamma-HCH transport system permease protein